MAIDHYNLARSQMLSHAFLQEPGRQARSARASNGPTRYSKYKFVVFLLTEDGVRRMSANSSFLGITIHPSEQTSYRYDAVSSARVALGSVTPEGPLLPHSVELTLFGGEPITITVSDLALKDAEDWENPEALAEAALDAASVADTLHVLEGIAAEGKAWFHESRRSGSSK